MKKTREGREVTLEKLVEVAAGGIWKGGGAALPLLVLRTEGRKEDWRQGWGWQPRAGV